MRLAIGIRLRPVKVSNPNLQNAGYEANNGLGHAVWCFGSVDYKSSEIAT